MVSRTSGKGRVCLRGIHLIPFALEFVAGSLHNREQCRIQGYRVRMETEYHGFPVTQWTMVDRAATVSTDAGFQALEDLLARYRPALSTYLVYVKKVNPDQAQDYIQGFLARKVLEGELLAQADKAKGRFRTYLLTAFNRYIQNEIEKQRAQKRTPDGGFVDLDEALDADAGVVPGSSIYDMAWAQEIINECVKRVREECSASGRSQYWLLFEARVIDPILHGMEAPSYEDLMSRVSFDSPVQASNALITVKRMFARTIKKIIGEYADGEDAIEQELDQLRDIFAQSV